MSANLFSSISQSYSQILPDARSYNTITNPVFIRNDGIPLSINSSGVLVSGDLAVSGQLSVKGDVTMLSSLSVGNNLTVPNINISSINSGTIYPIVNDSFTTVGNPYVNVSTYMISSFADGNPDGTPCLVSGQFVVTNTGDEVVGSNDYLVFRIQGGNGFSGGLYHTLPLYPFNNITEEATIWSVPVTGFIIKNSGSNIDWSVFGSVTNTTLSVSLANPTFQALKL